MTESIPDQIKHGLTEKDGEQPHTVLEHFVLLLVHPGRLFLSPFYRRLEQRYTKREKFEVKFLLTDIFLLLAALGLVGLVIGWLVSSNRIENHIFFEVQVAPTEIVSGAPSTLVIRYTNGTGQELKNVYLNLNYPAHFNLLELVNGETPVESNIISLGNLAPDAVGSIKIRGIMFGNVGGEQTFETKMTFNYGEKNRSGEKKSQYVFSPSDSVLQLSLELPEKIVAGQTFNGAVIYKNTGEFDLPEIKVQPTWPENFHLSTAEEKSWSVDSIKASEAGRMEFTGYSESGTENLIFSFAPSFVFGADEYTQTILTQEVSIIQPQIKLSHSSDSTTAKLGGSLKTTIRYENIGDEPVYDVKITTDSNSSIVEKSNTVSIETIAGHASGEVEIETKLRSSISQSSTSVYEHLNIDTRAQAAYKIEETETASPVTVYGQNVATPLTTPIVFRSFGRYASDQGDQLGRGPLPPTVDEETKYWIFWNISGTTNEIKNLTISGQLLSNVSFTGRQTVSGGESVSYDAANKTVSWQTSELSTTFAPTAKIVGIAFEVAITPTENQIGTSPTLISNVSLSGTDGWTNAWLTASGASVTTNLPSDSLAAGLGIVE